MHQSRTFRFAFHFITIMPMYEMDDIFCSVKSYLHVHILITPMLHNIKIPLICLITMTGMVSIFVLLDLLSCICISTWHQMLVALQGEGAGTRGACRREASRNSFAKQHQLWSHVTTEQWSSQTQNLQCKNQLNTGQRETDFNSYKEKFNVYHSVPALHEGPPHLPRLSG